MITERQRFRNWLAAQIADHGLIGIHVALASDPLGPDLEMDDLRFHDYDEAIFAALNEMNASVARGDYTLMGDI